MLTPIKKPSPLFPIGHKFKLKRGKKSPEVEHTIVDYLKTIDSKGELIKFRYVTTHIFGGQLIYDRDVAHFTINLATLREKA